MQDFDTALDPNYNIYARDIAADQAAAAGVVSAVDRAVACLKDLLRQDSFDSSAGMFHALCRVGQLLDMKNRLTGEKADLEYLLCDDNECLCYVAGFIGDPTGVSDRNGKPLCVGDTVMYQDGGKMCE